MLSPQGLSGRAASAQHLLSSCRCLTMRSLTAGLPSSGSTWAWSQGLRTGSLSLAKPSCPLMTSWGTVSRASGGREDRILVCTILSQQQPSHGLLGCPGPQPWEAVAPHFGASLPAGIQASGLATQEERQGTRDDMDWWAGEGTAGWCLKKKSLIYW